MPPQKPLDKARRLWKYSQAVAEVFTPSTILFSLVALALLGVGALGGWDHVRAASTELPVVKAGEKATGEPFELTVRKSWYTDELQGLLTKRDGRRYLLVTGSVTNTSKEPVLPVMLQGSLAVDVPGCRTDGHVTSPDVCRPDRLLRADGLDMGSLQPGMATDVVAVFEQDTTSPAPAAVDVELTGHTWRASSLDGGMDWRDPEPTAIVHVETRKYRG